MTRITFDPDCLGDAGRELYDGVTADFELRADELRVLQDACAEADVIAYLEDNWIAEGRPLTALGSAKQLVSHPTVVELRARRTALSLMLQRLKLNDSVDPDEFVIPVKRMTPSESGRKASNAKYAHRYDVKNG